MYCNSEKRGHHEKAEENKSCKINASFPWSLQRRLGKPPPLARTPLVVRGLCRCCGASWVRIAKPSYWVERGDRAAFYTDVCESRKLSLNESRRIHVADDGQVISIHQLLRRPPQRSVQPSPPPFIRFAVRRYDTFRIADHSTRIDNARMTGTPNSRFRPRGFGGSACKTSAAQCCPRGAARV